MKISTKIAIRVFWVVAVISFVTLSGALKINAQEKGVSLAQQIQGSWNLVSIYNEQDGKKIEQFGSNPRGSLILTPDGRFSLIMMRANLPKFVINARHKGTAEENQAVVRGSIAYFGRYSVVSDKESSINLHIEGSTFPNWDGQDQKRLMTLEGDGLKLVNPAPSGGGGTNYITWKRAK